MSYIISLLILIFIWFIFFLILLKNKIIKLSWEINTHFIEKTNLIPAIYDTTSLFLNKHNEIFAEILKLKKQDFSQNSNNMWLMEKMNTYEKIHNEMNFIFKVANKHPKIQKYTPFLYIRDVIMDKSQLIWKKIEIYKKITQTYNQLINIKNYSIIGLLFPLNKFDTI